MPQGDWVCRMTVGATGKAAVELGVDEPGVAEVHVDEHRSLQFVGGVKRAMPAPRRRAPDVVGQRSDGSARWGLWMALVRDQRTSASRSGPATARQD